MVLNNATNFFKILTFGEFEIEKMKKLIEAENIRDIIEKMMKNYDRDFPYHTEILRTETHTFYVQSK